MTSMEESWTDWLCDMEPDDYSLINQSGINVDIVAGSLVSQHDANNTRESSCSYATFYTQNTKTSSVGESSLERPSKLLVKTSCNSNSVKTGHLLQKTASSPSGSYILSFENAIPPPIKAAEPALKPKTKIVNSKNETRRVIQESNKKISSLSRFTHHTPPDHIIAERIRREKISQQFIALSALIPDLKKMDKASVLGDAIKYVKQLKEQVKLMEEQRKRKSVESVMVMKKCQLSADDVTVSDTSSNSCNGNSDEHAKTNLSLPEVEAKVSGKNVLIRIVCEKDKTVLPNTLTEIEKLHLSVTNCSSLSFGSSVLAITILAEMEDELNLSAQKLAKNVRVGLMQLM